MTDFFTMRKTQEMLNKMHSDIQKTEFANDFSHLTSNYIDEINETMHQAQMYRYKPVYSEEQKLFKETIEEELMIDETTFERLSNEAPELEVVKNVKKRKSKLHETANASGVKKVFKGISKSAKQNARDELNRLRRKTQELQVVRESEHDAQFEHDLQQAMQNSLQEQANAKQSRREPYSVNDRMSDEEKVARMRQENEHINVTENVNVDMLTEEGLRKDRLLRRCRNVEEDIYDNEGMLILQSEDIKTLDIYSKVNNTSGDGVVDIVTEKMINFNTINTALRTRKYRKGGGKQGNCSVEESWLNNQQIDKMKQLIEKNSIPENMLLKRGTSLEGALKFLGVSEGTFGKDPQQYLSKHHSAINDHRIVSDAAFLSTSPFAGYSFAPAQIVINAKKGDKAIYLEGISNGEYEVLYQAGSRFRLLDIEFKNDQWFFYIDSLGQHDPI